FSRILARYFIPKEEIEKMVIGIRAERYEMFRTLPRGIAPACTLQSCLPDLEIASFRIESGAPVIGKTIQETEMRKRHGVTLLAINRSAQIMTNPSADTEFAAEDILFVVGDAKNIQQTRLIFNQGQREEEKNPLLDPL
ncbi:MAG: cation:proton antiporter regulatory subunit, partial [Syntrophales bacterium]